MGAAALSHHPLPPLPQIPITASPVTNNRRSGQNDVVLSMRLGLIRDLPLRRSFAYQPITAVDYPRSQDQPPKTPAAMTTKNENPAETTSEDAEKEKKTKVEKEEKKKKVSLPPPPEKPEPGDCCGSGCVRCVWDVYYEELEEYNKLCQSISGEPKLD